jgi:hypothetical protein
VKIDKDKSQKLITQIINEPGTDSWTKAGKILELMRKGINLSVET